MQRRREVYRKRRKDTQLRDTVISSLIQDRLFNSTKIVAGKSFIEEVLSVDILEEYLEHFSVLEIDFTFYRPLLENDGRPTQNHNPGLFLVKAVVTFA